jgi:putative oxidoreductase
MTSSTPSTPTSPIALAPAVHGLVRVITGLLFLQHGLQKLFGLLGGVNGGTVPIASLMGAAGIIEFVGGILIIIGLFTRPVALLLIAEMIGALFMVHFPQGGFPIQNGGELALLYVMLFAFLAVYGAGPFSVDASLRRRKLG